MTDRLNVLINAPRWYVRPKSTDWRYNAWLTQLDQMVPVDTRIPFSPRDIFEFNANWALRKLRLPLFPLGRVQWREEDADVIFNHREFPIGSPVPVVWLYGTRDPAMLEAAGFPSDELERQYEFMLPSAKEAAQIQIVIVSSIDRHVRHLGIARERFSECPMFLPHLEITARDTVHAKQVEKSDRVRILIVGHEAKRKGLDLLLANIARLAVSVRQRIRLDVVGGCTDLRREDVVIPADAEVHFHNVLPRAETMDLFARAQIYCMPSRFETIGFSFIEAMAAGCAVIACDWEGQQDILDHGRAGWLVDPFGDFSRILEEAIDDRDRRTEMALKGRDRAAARYAPEVVASGHLEMFRRAVALGPGTAA